MKKMAAVVLTSILWLSLVPGLARADGRRKKLGIGEDS
jgi:hypothetical protein